MGSSESERDTSWELTDWEEDAFCAGPEGRRGV